MTFERCEAFTKKGVRCQNGVVPATRYCGPHQDEAARGKPKLTDQCEAMTKSGEPCRSGAVPGERFCGPHLAEFERRKARPE